MIHESPSHIYHSALPFSPSSSWLRECYKEELAQEVKVVTGLPDEWDTCSRTIFFQGRPSALACREDIVAVGLRSNDIAILDAITGSSTSVLSGHTDVVSSLAFSLDGTLLVSGSKDKTVKLWDVQTGGAIKTFRDTDAVSSVSISPDRAVIASGSQDDTISLWDVRTGERLPVRMRHRSEVTAVSFRPTDSRHLISSSLDGTVRQWNTDGSTVTSCLEAAAMFHVAYSSDGTRFISCGGTIATVRDSKSGAVVAKLPAERGIFRYGCFSPNGRFVACAVDDAVCVWDITRPGPRLVGNLLGHTKEVISIVFSSSLISGSLDQSVKFWQFGSSSTSTDPVTTNGESALLASATIESVNLFAEDSVAVTSDSSGVVKTWDIATGKCKSSFSTPAEGPQDTHFSNGTLTIVWYKGKGRSAVGGWRIWDVGEGRLLRTVRRPLGYPLDLKISEDGSRMFVLSTGSIDAFSMQTGERAGHVQNEPNMKALGGPLVVHGSHVWLIRPKRMGWEFGAPGVPPLPLSGSEFPDRHRLDFVDRSTRHGTRPAWIQDTTTGNLVFRLPERYMKPSTKTRWDGRYLVVGSPSGVTIVDFNHLNPQQPDRVPP